MTEFMRRIQTQGAARLYGWLLENGEVEVVTTLPEMSYKTGIAANDTLVKARQELAELGVLTCTRQGKSHFLIKLTNNIPQLSHNPIQFQPQEEESLYDRCLLTDASPESGSPQDPYSDVSKKRKKQISLVKEIFNQNFPEAMSKFPLQDGGARDLLRVQPRTEEILNAVETVVTQAEQSGKPIASPLGYVKATLTKRIANGEVVMTTALEDDFSPEQIELRRKLSEIAEVPYENPWEKYNIGGAVYA